MGLKRIVIAAPSSGSGKTTVTLGVMAALRRRGLKVAPFKVGPDFIDPGYHRLATGVPSVNLDGWICAPRFLRESFLHHAAASDIAVIEGAMGLFDGIDGVSESGSSAQVAKELSAPVVLVVDARSQARSAAALVHGFASFDPALRLAGVIFNNVASENHERILREALGAAVPGVRVLGCLPKDPALAIPSRHLGLVTAEDNPLSDAFLDHLIAVVEGHLNLDALLGLEADELLEDEAPSAGSLAASQDRVKIAVARDAAFCFVYQDNLRLLENGGAELCYFSPLADESLPQDIGGIYLPGGYPELFAQRLAANEPMKELIRQAVEGGMPVYAECGGFIYLTRGVAAEGETHAFTGIFPVETRMLPRRKALGYREVELLEDCTLGRKGSIARGHEFHYSEMGEMPPHVERLYRVTRKGVELAPEGYRYKNCLASYIHLHFGSSPGLAPHLVEQGRAYQKRSLT